MGWFYMKKCGILSSYYIVWGRAEGQGEGREGNDLVDDGEN
jgi:hypothetical protein